LKLEIGGQQFRRGGIGQHAQSIGNGDGSQSGIQAMQSILEPPFQQDMLVALPLGVGPVWHKVRVEDHFLTHVFKSAEMLGFHHVFSPLAQGNSFHLMPMQSTHQPDMSKTMR
jgi:hypothetical protein